VFLPATAAAALALAMRTIFVSGRSDLATPDLGATALADEHFPRAYRDNLRRSNLIDSTSGSLGLRGPDLTDLLIVDTLT